MSAAVPDRRRFPDPVCVRCGHSDASSLRAIGGHGSTAFRWECRDREACRSNRALTKSKEANEPTVGEFVLGKRQ